MFHSVSAMEQIKLENVPKNEIELKKEPVNVKGSMLISDEQTLKELVEFQKKKDLEDILSYWIDEYIKLVYGYQK